MLYFFILGRSSSLSEKELEQKLQSQTIKYSIIDKNELFFLIETAEKVDSQIILELGGTIKFGQILQETQRNEIQAENLVKFLKIGENKFPFGLSLYGLNTDIQKIGFAMKKILKKNGASVRFVTAKEYPLSSVIVQKEILNKGSELVILKGEKYWIGQTLSVQSFGADSHFDFGRPARDARRGMLPPKLARMMLNLAGKKKEAVILDPFCGTGTVLQEALRLGYQNLIGFDLDPQAIKQSKKNLDWLIQELKIKNNPRLEVCDASDLREKLSEKSIDAIVSEPLMGSPLTGRETEKEVQKMVNELTTLYSKSIISFSKVLKNNGIVIFIIPEFKFKNKSLTFNLPKILQAKFKILEHLTWSREDQKVIRHIYKLSKT